MIEQIYLIALALGHHRSTLPSISNTLLSISEPQNSCLGGTSKRCNCAFSALVPSSRTLSSSLRTSPRFLGGAHLLRLRPYLRLCPRVPVQKRFSRSDLDASAGPQQWAHSHAFRKPPASGLGGVLERSRAPTAIPCWCRGASCTDRCHDACWCGNSTNRRGTATSS